MSQLPFTDALAAIGAKLKKARQEKQYSTRAVADHLSKFFPVSHATIANYEKGKTRPSMPVLAAMAELYGWPINSFLECGPTLTGIRYRGHHSKLRVSDRLGYEAKALRWLEGYLRIEKSVGQPLVAKYKASAISGQVDPRKFATEIRKLVGVGANDPVPSVIDVLEGFGIRVLELPTTLPIDGFAAMLGNDPVVVLNSARSNDRQRLNASHELFHLLLLHCAAASSETKEEEDCAFACARHFMLPLKQLKEAFLPESVVTLVKFKEVFRISLSAMIYSAKVEGVIPESAARHLWIEFAKRGWRANEPGVVKADPATRFEQLVDGAVNRSRLTWQAAAQLVGVREDEIRERVRSAMRISAASDPDETIGAEGGEPSANGLRLAK